MRSLTYLAGLLASALAMLAFGMLAFGLTLLCAAVARADSSSDARAALALASARQAPTPPQAPAIKSCPCFHGEVCECKVCACHVNALVNGALPPGVDPYADAVEEAFRRGVPLVCFVGQPSRPIEGAVVAYRESYRGDSGPFVFVSRPERGELYRFATLPGRPTVGNVKESLPGGCATCVTHPGTVFAGAAVTYTGGYSSGGCASGNCGSASGFSGFASGGSGGCASGNCGGGRRR